MKKQLLLTFLMAIMGLIGNSMGVWAQGVPEPTAQWNFNDANDLMKPDKGSLRMIPALLGSRSITLSTLSEAKITQTDGPTADNKALYVPAASALKVERAEGAEATTSYSLMMDIMVPDANSFDGLFQTKEENDNDGDLFTNKNKIGIGSFANGGYFGSIKNGKWYRVILSFRDGKVILYLDGKKLVTSDPDSNVRHKIMPFGFYLFCDEDDEKTESYVSGVAFWEAPLTDEQVSELGAIPAETISIATPEDFNAFAEKVKNGKAVNGQLTADIDLSTSAYPDLMIGTEACPFSGTFDGGNHTITYKYTNVTDKWRGLFAFVDGATIRNLRVEGSAYVTNIHYGALIGRADGNVLVENVITNVDITGAMNQVTGDGGMLGANYANITFNNCATLGKMGYDGSSMYSSFSAWGDGSSSTTLNNCYSACELTDGTGTGNCFTLTHSSGKVTINNSYYLNPIGTVQGSQVSEEEIASGELCFKLNGDQTTITWYQALGTDQTPVPDATHGQVYLNGRLHCNGDAYEGSTFSNTYAEVSGKDDHHVVDGFCDYCGLYFEDGLTPNADGFYEITNAKQLTWFRMKVNKGTNNANAILTADIDFADLMPEDADPEETEIEWVPIGDWNTGNVASAYAGHFNGQGHTIKNLNFTAKQNFNGLFGVITTGAVIENFNIYGTYRTTYQYLGGVAGYARDDELGIRNVHSYVNIFNTNPGGRQGGIMGGAHGTKTFLENCIYSGTMDSNDNGGGGNYGGIIGYVQNATSVYVDITNCLFNGRLFNSAATPGDCTFGGIVGYANAPFVTIKNCLSIGTVESARYAQFFGALNGNNSKIYNSYYKGDNINGSGSGGKANPSEATLVTDDQLSNGEIAWKLNGESFIDVAWCQDLSEDDTPTPITNGKVVYLTANEDYDNINPDDLESFISNIVTIETTYLEHIVAYKELTDAYTAEIETWDKIEKLEEFLQAYKAAQEIKENIKKSAANYSTYVQTCKDAAKYIEDNQLEGKWTDFLLTYLDEETEQEPDNDYPNGSYAYIMEKLDLNDEAILAEVTFVNQMLENAIAGGITSGTEITRLLVNPTFADGYEGWTVEFEGGTADVAGNTEIMPIPEAFNNKSFNASQKLTELPNGIYMMAINGLFRAGTDVTSKFYAGQFYLNNTYNYFMTQGEDVVSADEAEPGVNCLGENSEDAWYADDTDGWVPNSRNGCSVAFKAERYLNFCATEVTDSTLTIGMCNPATGLACDWMPFGNPHIYYLGTADEANEKLTDVLNGYKKRAEVIKKFVWSEGTEEYTQYPNMAKALKDQLDELINAVPNATSGEEKMNLINRFSALFTEVYACRKAYISMLGKAYNLYDLINAMDQKSLISQDTYNEWDKETNAAQIHYINGDISTEEALAIIEKFDNADLIDLPSVNGVYQLATAKDLLTFARVVNFGMNTSDAVLVNDIDMTGCEWSEPIGDWNTGNTKSAYAGHFDGQGHTISNLEINASKNFYGLFGVITTGCNIENFNIYGSLSTAYQYAGGVAAFARDDELAIRNVHSYMNIDNTCAGGRQGGILGGAHGTMTIIEGCTYSGTLNASDAGGGGNYGGIVGYVQNDTKVYANISNCLYDGKLENTAATPGSCTFGGIVGYANAPYVTLKNCLSIGTVKSARYAQFFGALNGNNSKIYNSYYQGDNINGSGSGGTANPQEATKVTDEQLASGEICFKLNGDQSVFNWYQNLGEDKYPVLDNTHKFVAFDGANGYINVTDEVGVNGPASDFFKGEGAIYDLSGRKVNSQLKKGIYIINGKKVLF
ncbi:MAG: hypothetical protein K6F47_06945 [Bacteroidaceae bacterium]|nr:hypothetical protein [Bacteroidaceae bacterium]